MGITLLPWNEQNFYKLWERKGREHKEKISIKKGPRYLGKRLEHRFSVLDLSVGGNTARYWRSWL